MRTYFFEATNGFNWGKFIVGVMDTEHEWRSHIDSANISLIDQLGWSDRHLWVMDLATGEGALFAHGGLASADLNKHKIWVCPLFEPFLAWLYTVDRSDIPALAHEVVTLKDAESSFYGYRRSGCARGRSDCPPRRMIGAPSRNLVRSSRKRRAKSPRSRQRQLRVARARRVLTRNSAKHDNARQSIKSPRRRV